MNLQAYANHRRAQGLRGQSHVAVLKAIQGGRLHPPAVRKEGRGWVIDPTLADQQWEDNTDHGLASPPPAAAGPARARPPRQAPVPPAAPPAAGVPALVTSKSIKAAFDAKLAQLEYQQRSGELGPVRDMEREAFSLGKTVRESMLSIVPRVAPDLAALDDTLAIERLLEDEITAALRMLSDG